MNFGFDIDGTISAAPEAYSALIASLMASGHHCHVLTGTMDPVATEDHYAKRRQQLAELGIRKWTALHIVTAPHVESKTKYCQDHEIAFMFEDSPVYAEGIRHVTTCVLMCPPVD